MAKAQKPLYSNKQFAVYGNKIVQGKYTAEALSATALKSNYQSPVNLFQPADISFKFAINGRDNEMMAGTDHHFTVNAVNGKAETPLIVFGEPINKVSAKKTFLQPETKLTIRLDFRKPLKEMAEKGYFTCYNGTKIYKQDFKGVFIAGNTAPMSWDFDNLHNRKELLLNDTDGDGILETTLILNAKADKLTTDDSWQLTKDLSAYPSYQSPYLLSDALYKLSLEEMVKAIEPDSTFRTGKEWGGVWTRDISYSIILAMAHLQPAVAKYSLMRKVNGKKKIIQDTGTGGAWPVSTDRMIWAVAAWELFKTTGDEAWLKEAYEIIKNSITDDEAVAYDAVTGLVKGESSFLDWREQTYPKWMQPADIFESECLGTNAVHYQVNKVMSEMATLLHDNSAAVKYAAQAERIKKGINQYLWLPEKGYYAQYLYGRTHKIASPRSEALGEALCVIFGIAEGERAKTIVSKTPVTAFGIPCIYPQIPDIPPYHNNGIWPFVQSYWLWAAQKVGNEQSVVESIAAIYRAAGMFLTNKENFVADDGDFRGTVINSSIMLWSLSGNISLVQKVIFGMQFQANSLAFKPFVPKIYAGKRSLMNVSYRNAQLNIEMEGFGNTIKAFYVNGKWQKEAVIPANLTGKHSIKIILNNQLPAKAVTNLVNNYTSLPTPIVTVNNNVLSWKAIPNAVNYTLLKNGKNLQTVSATKLTINREAAAEYQIIATDQQGISSFASEPVWMVPAEKERIIPATKIAAKANYPYQGFSGEGFVEISNNINTNLDWEVTASADGKYFIDFRYANGNGPVNTENKCAIRTLLVNNSSVGCIVLPQRGKGEWSNWGFTNGLWVILKKGTNKIGLQLTKNNDNMNEETNQAMIDYLRIIAL
ncbi:MAG: MGH1-like glycoside hydrolase domain-containing protein [Chitinophagaceae bacterium]